MARGRGTKTAGKSTNNVSPGQQPSDPETEVAKVPPPVISLQRPASTPKEVIEKPTAGSLASRPRRPGLTDRHIVEVNPELRISTQAEKSQVAQAKRDAKEAQEKEEAEKEEALRRKLEENRRQLAELMDAKAKRTQREKEGVEEPDEEGIEPRGRSTMEVDTEESRSQPPKPKLTEREKKQARATAEHAAIAALRQEAPTVPLQKRKVYEPSDDDNESDTGPQTLKAKPSASKKARVPAVEGFDEDWVAASSKKKGKKTLKGRKSKKKAQEKEPLGGFNDEDVRTERDDVLRVNTGKQLVTIIPPRSNKNAPAPHASGDSMALEMLPKFEQAIFESKLRPTMLQLFGSLPHPGPWDADHGHQRIFPAKLQEYHDKLVTPENQYDITPSHLISKKTRQAHADWKFRFGSRGVFCATEIIYNKFAPNSNTEQRNSASTMADLLEPEQAKIKQFVREALGDGGAAFWATPGDLEVRQGACSSPCVLKVFAHAHLSWVDGAIDTATPPYGAIAITLAGVERGWQAWETGKWLAPKKFNADNYEEATTDWYNNTVIPEFGGSTQGLERFTAFLSAAWEYVNAKTVQKDQALSVRTVVTRPSRRQVTSTSHAVKNISQNQDTPMADAIPEGNEGEVLVGAPNGDGDKTGTGGDMEGGGGEVTVINLEGSGNTNGTIVGGSRIANGATANMGGVNEKPSAQISEGKNDGVEGSKLKEKQTSANRSGDGDDKMGGEENRGFVERGRSLSTSSSFNGEPVDKDGWRLEIVDVQVTDASMQPPAPEQRWAYPKAQAEAWTPNEARVYRLRIRHQRLIDIGPYGLFEAEAVDAEDASSIYSGTIICQPNVGAHEGWDTKNMAINDLCNYTTLNHYARRFQALVTKRHLPAAVLSIADFDIVEEVAGHNVRRIWLRCWVQSSQCKHLEHYSIARAARHPGLDAPPVLIKNTLDAFNHYMHVHRNYETCDEYSYIVSEQPQGYPAVKIIYTRKHTVGDGVGRYYLDGREKRFHKTRSYHQCNAICHGLNLNSPADCTTDNELASL